MLLWTEDFSWNFISNLLYSHKIFCLSDQDSKAAMQHFFFPWEIFVSILQKCKGRKSSNSDLKIIKHNHIATLLWSPWRKHIIRPTFDSAEPDFKLTQNEAIFPEIKGSFLIFTCIKWKPFFLLSSWVTGIISFLKYTFPLVQMISHALSHPSQKCIISHYRRFQRVGELCA